MLDKKFRKAMDITVEKIVKENIAYMLAGSVNMALQGIDVIPKDLDFIVKLKDLEKIKEVFSDYGVSEIKGLKPLIDRPAWEVAMNIEGIDVQFLGERDDGEYVSYLLNKKVVEVSRVVCFDLKTEAEVYDKTGRHERARMIKCFLDKI